MHGRPAQAALAARFAAALVLARRPLSGRGDVRVTTAERWQRAEDAWAAGRYPDALDDLLAIVASPDASEYRDRIALLTGELFTTSTITADGRNPRLSTDGRYLLYDTGPVDAPITRLVYVDDAHTPTATEEFAGLSAAFNHDGTAIVYLDAPASEAWTEAVAKYAAGRTRVDRQAAQRVMNFLAGQGDLVVRDIKSGTERVLPTSGLTIMSPQFAADGRHVIAVGAETSDVSRTDVYLFGDAAPRALTTEPGLKTRVLVDPSGHALVYTVAPTAPFAAPENTSSVAGAPAPAPPPSFGIVDLGRGTTRIVPGDAPTMSGDGSTIAWIDRLDRHGPAPRLLRSQTLAEPDTVRPFATAPELDAPALSTDGSLIVYQAVVPPGVDWDVYLAEDGHDVPRRLTRDARHDVLPRFLTGTTVLAMTGESRDRRAHVYDLTTGARTRVFANNTLRTISPEYAWASDASGTRLAIEADRDGDTTSPAHDISLVNLSRKVTLAELAARLDRQRADEGALRDRMTAAFRPIAPAVSAAVARVAVNRVYDHVRALVDLDSKYIGLPGNLAAIDYVARAYRSFDYHPDIEWFNAAEVRDARTANVIAVKEGTTNPHVIYVVSSHFDSVVAGPGADDNASGTAALLETARILANVPLPATVVFASFTGEEAGLIGSREFVRRAQAADWRVAGAINNDMIGWSADGFRMDNTIRYSNDGIRDVQHGAAFLFSHLVTYDARYYKHTDAQAFHHAWGDIIGGLGSYPVLGNPNYHQATDVIETVNFQQVTEAVKVTVATLMYLASSPSPVAGVQAVREANGVRVTWRTNPESDIAHYLVAYGAADSPLATTVTSTTTSINLPVVSAGTVISVKAVNDHGLEGWDWTKNVLQ